MAGTPAPAAAQWFVGGYAGVAKTNSADIDAPDFSFTRFAAATDVGAMFDTHHFVFGASFKF